MDQDPRLQVKAQLLQELLQLMNEGIAHELKARHAPAPAAAEQAADESAPGDLDAPGVEVPGVEVPMDSADVSEPDLGSLSETELSALMGPDAPSDDAVAGE